MPGGSSHDPSGNDKKRGEVDGGAASLSLSGSEMERFTGGCFIKTSARDGDLILGYRVGIRIFNLKMNELKAIM